jgi:hypothetical protein
MGPVSRAVSSPGLFWVPGASPARIWSETLVWKTAWLALFSPPHNPFDRSRAVLPRRQRPWLPTSPP